MPKTSGAKALLIDANALLHRAWHALPPLTAPDGKLVNAVYGFASVLMKILDAERPEYLVVCWDTAAPTFRHTAAPEYKAQRVEQPQEFYDQIPLVKQVVDAFGGTNAELDGYEADDLLGTFATRLAKDGVHSTVLTSDRDVWQIIGPRVRVMAFKKGVSETVIYDETTLKETTGLAPGQIADYKALRGDASDNLKGVPGIGEKTATELLIAHKNLKGVFKAAHDPKSGLSPSVREKLLAGEKDADATLPLVQIVIDVPVKLKIADIARRPADHEKIRELFLALGFKTLLARALGAEAKRSGSSAKTRKAPVGVGTFRGTAPHVATSSLPIEKLSELLKLAREEGALYIHPAAAAQSSLFADIPEIALGTASLNLLVTKNQFASSGVRAEITRVLEDGALPKIGHGLKMAWHWCRERGIELDGIGFDTEIASYLIAAGEGGHELETMAASRLGIVLSEGEDRALSALDAVRQLHSSLRNELEEQQLVTVLERFELPLIPVLGKMETWGILINRTYLALVETEFRKTKERLGRDMVKLAGEDFNPASPIQLSHVLFDVLKIPTKGIKRGKTGISTAASELDKLEGAHPIIAKIGEYREISKLLSTYVEALPALADAKGRVHTTFNQAVTSTGRLSSTNPNLQNIPIRTELGRRIRRAFVAERGYLLLSCDYSQIELRVVAALAHDAKMLEAFQKGLDIHTATAAAIWQIPLDVVTKDQRRAAKAINFGIIYGQGPHGLARAAGIPYEEARHFIEEYFHAYSGVREYLDNTKALAHVRGYVETLFGRRRPIPEINSPRPEILAAAERMAINMPVQGTAADIMKLAMIAVAHGLPALSKNARMLLQVHDELVFEVPEKEAVKLAPKIISIMENMEKIGCPIVVEAKIGKNWEEMETIHE